MRTEIIPKSVKRDQGVKVERSNILTHFSNSVKVMKITCNFEKNIRPEDIMKRLRRIIPALAAALVSLLCTVVATLPGFAQNPDNGTIMQYTVVGRDTIFLDKLNPLYVRYKPSYKRGSKEWREFRRLVYNFRKVYPYALKCKEIIRDADSTLAHASFTKRQRAKYIKQYEKRLFREFEQPLRKLTFSQGKLLLKLIDREVGLTSYYLIKNYKGGAAAGFWQFVAKIFDSDLKKQYDRFGEDKTTEYLVSLWQEGTFEALYRSMFN